MLAKKRLNTKEVLSIDLSSNYSSVKNKLLLQTDIRQVVRDSSLVETLNFTHEQATKCEN